MIYIVTFLVTLFFFGFSLAAGVAAGLELVQFLVG